MLEEKEDRESPKQRKPFRAFFVSGFRDPVLISVSLQMT
jgi:hypothetical protein